MEVVAGLKHKYPGISEIHLAKNVMNNGINYKTGMLIALGSAGGLPELTEILQMCIIKSNLSFAEKIL